MNQFNPYFHTYLQQMRKVKDIQSKQHFLGMAMSLAHVHNLLGLMISDIIKFMGTVPLDQGNGRNQHDHLIEKQSNQKKAQPQSTSFPPNHIISGNPNFDKYAPSKIDTQTYPSKPLTTNQNQQPIAKDKRFPTQLFQTEQKSKPQIIKEPLLKDFYRQLMFTSQKKSSQGSNQASSPKGSNDSSSSKTQTAQIVRNNQNEKKMKAKNSFDQLNQYPMEIDNTYNINVKQPKVEEKKVKKYRSPFFDLFDSSQTQSYDQSPILQNYEYQNNQDVQIDKPSYPQSQQVNYDSNSVFKKASRNLYSPQLKKEKPVDNLKKNAYQKPSNLLDITQWNNSGQSDMFQVQEQIDELESTQKKPGAKLIGNQKDLSKRVVQSDIVEYIPRREQKGRKKSDRQGLQGSQCPDCKAFYEAVSQDSKDFRNMCQCTSRHKSSTTFMGKHKVQDFSQDFQLN